MKDVFIGDLTKRGEVKIDKQLYHQDEIYVNGVLVEEEIRVVDADGKTLGCNYKFRQPPK